jgi:glycosyltransferase involved in cell wall biosynthesis
MKKYPIISIITPTYNQGQFLEETIHSVLNQRYPNLEYIIIDGGSTDNSVNIIEKYEDYLSYWISEPDKGQANAINKGLRRSTGDVLMWINSDDYLLPKALSLVTEVFNENNSQLGIVYGYCQFIKRDGKIFEQRKFAKFDSGILRFGQNLFAQPASFFHRRVLDKIGLLNENLNFAMDYEYWIRAYEAGFTFKNVDFPLAAFRMHGCSKTVNKRSQMKDELNEITLRNVLQLKKNWLNLLITRGIISLFRLKNVFLRGIQQGQWSFRTVSRARIQK